MDMSLLSPCNVYCGNCILYKKNKCLGCAKETAKRETGGKVFCDIYLCAKDKKLTTHAPTAKITHAKNTTKESLLRASSNG